MTRQVPETQTDRRDEARAGPTAVRPVPAADADPADRPGVPKEAGPREGGEPPMRQPAPRKHLRRAGLDRLTPVFGTGQPPRGASGVVRRVAYAVPEHRASHWMLLMAADRVDVLEHRAGAALSRPVAALGWTRLARTLRRHPALFAAGAAAATLAARRALATGADP